MSKAVIAKFPKAYRELDNPYRYKMIYGGRGKGASWTVARKLLIRGTERPLRILCTRELQKSIKQSVHRLLSDQITRLELKAFYEIQQQGIFGKNGTEIFFLGVKANPEEIKSMEGIDICWIEEAHALSETSWDIIDPTIRKEKSEIWGTWNTRFKFDYMHHKFVVNKPPPDSLVLNINYQDNCYFPEVLKKQMEHMKETDYEKYLHVWEGELKLLAEGAIFGKQVVQTKKDKRLLRIPVVSNIPVSTFFDIGKSDHTAIWFMQKVGMEYRFIDFYMNRLQDVEHYVKVLNKLDYNYDRHYMPFDADHDRLGMKNNIKEQFISAGIKPVTIVSRIQVKQTAIELGRNIFQECYFHRANDERGVRMEKGWDALCNYRYKYSDDDDVYNKKPHHDWASNPADAFLQFAQGYNKHNNLGCKPIIMDSSFNVF